MVKFVAQAPVDASALLALGFLFDPLGVVTGAIFSNETDTGYSVDTGPVHVDLEGSGFTYFGGAPHPVGTIDRIDVSVSGAPAYQLKGLDADVASIVAAPDLTAAIADLFAGNDKFKGSSGDDFFVGGGGNDKFLGKDGDDTLAGNDGKDNFDGGRGSDTYDGGGGKDVYVFKDAPDSGVDTIEKYQRGEHIKLDGHDFKHLGSKGRLDADFFVDGTKAKDGDDHIIYDKATGHLLYDDDGKGGDHAVLFAVLANHPGHLDSDLIIVI